AIWMAGAAIPYVDLFSRLVFRRRSGHFGPEGQLCPEIAKGYNREEGQRIARKDYLGGESASAPEKKWPNRERSAMRRTAKSLW
ncbi:MAG: hypothetical protein ABSH41_08490, partial [Syntrophobacteraceae bacterium]